MAPNVPEEAVRNLAVMTKMPNTTYGLTRKLNLSQITLLNIIINILGIELAEVRIAWHQWGNQQKPKRGNLWRAISLLFLGVAAPTLWVCGPFWSQFQGMCFVQLFRASLEDSVPVLWVAAGLESPLVSQPVSSLILHGSPTSPSLFPWLANSLSQGLLWEESKLNIHQMNDKWAFTKLNSL